MADEPLYPLDLGETEESQPIDLGAPNPQAIDGKVLEMRARKYDFALGQDSPGLDILKYSIANGTELGARQDAFLKEQEKIRSTQSEVMKQMILDGQMRTRSDLDTFKQVTETEALKLNPDFIFEKMYADKVLTTGLTTKENSIVQDATKEDEGKAIQIVDDGTKVLRRQQMALKKLEELQQEMSQMGWVPFLGDFGETLVPGFSWYNQTNLMDKGTGMDLILGTNKRGQALSFYQEPDDKVAQAMLDSAIQQLKQSNMHDAVSFASFMAGATLIDEIMDNLLSAADVSIAGEVAVKGVLSTATKLANKSVGQSMTIKTQELTKATKDVIQSASTKNTTPEQVLEGAGDLASSSTALALQKIQNRADAVGRSASMEAMRGELYTIGNPQQILTGAENVMSTTGQIKLRTTLENNAEKLVKGLLVDPLDITLASPKTMKAAVDDAIESFKQQHTTLSSAILDIGPRRFTPEEQAARAFAGVQEQLLGKEMEKIRQANKMNDYVKYTFTHDEFNRLKQELKDLANIKIMSIDSPKAGARRNSAGVLMNDTSFFKKLGKSIDDALKREEKAGRVAGPEIIKKVEEIKRLIDALKAVPPKDRNLYKRVNRTARVLQETKPVEKSIPDTRLVKDLGNTPMVGIKLGARTGAVLSPEQLAKLSDVAAIKLGHAHEAGLFDAAETAKFWADNIYKLKEYNIGQQGTGFYIEVFKPLDFSTSNVQNALKLETRNANKSMETVRGLGFFIDPQYQFSRDVMQDRYVATFGVSTQEALLKQALSDVNKLPGKLSPSKLWRKDSREDFVDFISKQRVAPNPDDPKMPGKFSKTQAEFAKEWSESYGRLPTDTESNAYWSYVQLSQAEFAITNLRIYSAKSRLGWEMHEVGKAIPGSFEGKFLKDGVPVLREDAGVLVMGPEGATKLEYLRTMGGGAKRGGKVPTADMNRSRLDDLVKQGYKTVQINHLAEENLRAAAKAAGRKLPDGEINFILTKELNSSPLSYVQIPNRAGGHHYYTAEAYLRQPKIRYSPGRTPKTTDAKYYGDFNVAGFQTRAEAEKFAKAFNTAQDMYNDIKLGRGKYTQADMDDFARKNLPYSGKTLREMFDNGHFDAQTRFYATPANETVDKTHKLSEVYNQGRFTRAADSELDMFKDIDLRNALERGDTLQTFANVGTKENPLFKIEPAKMLDPLPTIERMAGEVMRGRYIEDLKWKSAQRFIAEFGDMLKPSERELWQDPLRWLYEAPFRENVLKERGRLNAAVSYRRSTLQFLNVRSPFERDQRWLRSAAMDWLYDKGGYVANKVIDPWAMHADKNVAQKLKNFTYHAFMSLNPSQYFKQAQAVFTVAGIKSFSAPHRMLQIFPATAISSIVHWGGDNMIPWASKAVQYATAGTWKAPHFEEAWKAMKRVGFDSVGYERADMASYLSPNITNGAWGKALDYAQFPVREGERVTRHAAWMGAYDEWRVANPTAKFNDDAIKSILDRASLFMADMSKASSAGYQEGFLGVASQFMPFNIKVFEAMAAGISGKSERLSRTEAAGAMVMNAFLYGAPISVGLASMGVVGQEEARKWALKNGYDPENFLSRMAWYGAIDTLILKPIFGEHTNFGERYGPGNMSLVKDFFWGNDKTPFTMLTGMSGTYLRDTLYAMDPFRMALVDGVTLSPNAYQLTSADFNRLFSTMFTGYNTAHKLLIAMNTGNYMTRSGNIMDETTKVEALFRAFLGIDPQRIADIPKIRAVEKDVAALQRKLEPDIRRELKAAIEAFRTDNDAAGYLHHSNMMGLIAAGGWSPKDRIDLIPRLLRGLENDVDEVSRRFAMKDSARMKAFLNRIQNKKPE